jgi:hypothetical protein
VNNVNNIIDQLEKQRSAIDRAISALREIAEPSGTAATAAAPGQTQPGRRLSPEGRKRIIAGTKKRWAAKRAAQAAQGLPKAAPSHSKRTMTAAVKRKLSLAAKRRWALIKQRNPNAKKLGA